MRLRDPSQLDRLLSFDGRIAERGELLELLAASGAVLQGHFSLQSGRHSEHFLRFNDVRDQVARFAAAALRDLSIDAAWQADGGTILCPESAGFLLGHALSVQAGLPLAVAKVDMRRMPMAALRSGDIKPGVPVLLVNDVSTTGSSLQPMLELVKLSGARLRAVSLFAAFDSGEVARSFPDAVVSTLATLKWTTAKPGPATCRGCAEGVPLTPSIDLN